MRVGCRILAGNLYTIRKTASVVTTRATTGTRHYNSRIGMIGEGGRKCRCGMTGITFSRNAWMSRWIGIRVGAGRNNAVVTGRTGFSCRRVIKGRAVSERDEMGSGFMAITTFLGCRNVQV